jgi:drug/metabolite transporter (DMT)-like permease
MPSSSRNGFLFALAGFGLLAIGDAVVKSMAGQWPGTAVAALRFCFGVIGLGVILLMKEGRSGFSIPMPKFQLLRGAGLAGASLCFFSAIFLMPLVEAVAIQFTSPMLTAILSMIFLGERMSKFTMIATGMAFFGVLLILRPNIDELGWAALLPLVAALGMGLVMIGNRAVAGTGSALQMQFLIAAFAAPILLTAAAVGHLSGFQPLIIDVPDNSVLIKCLIIAISASISHALVYLGTTRSSAAQIAPAVYIQILIAITLGMLLFNDIPDLMSISGSIIIVTAGLLVWRSNATPSHSQSGIEQPG